MAPRSTRSSTRAAAAAAAEANLGVRRDHTLFKLTTDQKLIIDSWRSEHKEFVTEGRRIVEEEFDTPMFYDFINGETEEERERAEFWFEINGHNNDPMMIDGNDEVMAEVNAVNGAEAEVNEVNDGGDEAEFNEFDDGGAEADVIAVDDGGADVNAVNDGEAVVVINANNGGEAEAEVNVDNNGEADANAVNDGEAMDEINADNGNEAEAEVNTDNNDEAEAEAEVIAVHDGASVAEINAHNVDGTEVEVNAHNVEDTEAEVDAANDDETQAEMQLNSLVEDEIVMLEADNSQVCPWKALKETCGTDIANLSGTMGVNHAPLNLPNAVAEVIAVNGAGAVAELNADNNDVAEAQVIAVHDGGPVAETNADKVDGTQVKVNAYIDDEAEAEAEVDAADDDETQAEMRCSFIEDEIMMLEVDNSQVCPCKAVKEACGTDIADLSGTMAMNDATLNLPNAVADAEVSAVNDAGAVAELNADINDVAEAEVNAVHDGDSVALINEEINADNLDGSEVEVNAHNDNEAVAEAEVNALKDDETILLKVDNSQVCTRKAVTEAACGTDIAENCEELKQEVEDLKKELKEKNSEVESLKHELFKLKTRVGIFKDRCKMNESKIDTVSEQLKSEKNRSSLLESKVLREEEYIKNLRSFHDQYDHGSLRSLLLEALPNLNNIEEVCTVFFDLLPGFSRKEKKNTGNAGVELSDVGDASLRKSGRDLMQEELPSLKDDCQSLLEKNEELRSLQEGSLRELVRCKNELLTLNDECLRLKEKNKELESSNAFYDEEIEDLRALYITLEAKAALLMQENLRDTEELLRGYATSDSSLQRSDQRVESQVGDVPEDEITTTREIPKVRRKIHAPSKPSKISHTYSWRSVAQSSEPCRYNLRSRSRLDEKSSVTLKRSASSGRNETIRLVVKRQCRLNPPLQTLREKAEGKSTRGSSKKRGSDPQLSTGKAGRGVVARGKFSPRLKRCARTEVDAPIIENHRINPPSRSKCKGNRTVRSQGVISRI